MSFIPIQQRAISRHGSLAAILPMFASPQELVTITDDRYLSNMCRVINNAGFNWTVIAKKWPQFEEAFLGFNPHTLCMLSPEQWDNYMSDRRIVRHSKKIQAVYENTVFVLDIAHKHGSFGQFLSDWPSDDISGLLFYLKKHGSRLGGNTGQWFLRSVGKDTFVLTQDVIRGLQEAGLDISDSPSSQRDFNKIQQLFNQWQQETQLPFCHLSRIIALATGSIR